MQKLIYNGSGFVPGVPARNLSIEEAIEYGGVEALLNSGAYRLEDDIPQPAKTNAKKKAGAAGEGE